MTCYRITRFKVLDLDKMTQIAEGMRDTISAAGADFIDVAADDDGNGAVVARYPDEATMEAATTMAQAAFGQMVAEGAADSASIQAWSAEVIFSF